MIYLRDMLDHIVYLVPDLKAAVARLSALGLPFSPGGRHLQRGTHNALLRLGPRSYLELLAPDPDSTIPPPRWMGIDLGQLPRISRWAVHAGANISQKAILLGKHTAVQSGQRQLPGGELLRWQLTDPGSSPATEVLPFLIDWGGADSVHPCDSLPDRGVTLGEFRLYHPEPAGINKKLRQLGLNEKAVRGDAPKLEACFHGRLGPCWL